MNAAANTTCHVAYCTTPGVGGTFNTYRLLYDALEPQGIRVTAVTVGGEAETDPTLAYGRCVEVAPQASSSAEAARAFLRWVEEQRIDIVMPLNSMPALGAVPHLPPRVRVVHVCSSITPHAYRVVADTATHASTIVCCSPRQCTDLTRQWRVPADRLSLVPHGLDVDAFTPPTLENHNHLSLGYIGRLADVDKGVMLLPAILKRLRTPPERWTLTIVGAGCDEPRLRRALAPWIDSGHVVMAGPVDSYGVRAHLQQMHALIIPSRWESFGWSLLESMAAGVAPVVSRVRGVTDWIVHDGETGMLAPIGDAAAFAAAIDRFADDLTLPQRLGAAARADVRERFSLERFQTGWRQVVVDAMAAPASGDRRSDADAIEVPVYRSWRRFIPASLKGRARGWLERFRAK